MIKSINIMKELAVEEMPIPFDYKKTYEKEIGFHSLPYYNKRYCGCCGKLIGECNHKLKKSNTIHEYTLYQHAHFETHNEYLVIRFFDLWCYENPKMPHTEIQCREIARVVCNNKLNTIVARKNIIGTMGWYNYYTNYNYASKMKIRAKNDAHINNLCYTQNVSGKSPFKYLKISYLKHGFNYLSFFKEWQKDTQFIETLCKLKRFDLLNSYFKNKELKDIVWLMMRHNKKIPKLSDYDYFSNWETYCNRLLFLSKDIKNINIICPDDFDSAYNTIQRQYKKAVDKVDLENAIKEYTENYKNHIANIKPIKEQNIVLQIMPNIQSFYEAGELEFHNCLWTRKYYKKEKSFVFYVVIDNEIMEICEYQLLNNNIHLEQCYGKCNNYTEYHSKILEFLGRNENKIKEMIV